MKFSPASPVRSTLRRSPQRFAAVGLSVLTLALFIAGCMWTDTGGAIIDRAPPPQIEPRTSQQTDDKHSSTTPVTNVVRGSRHAAPERTEIPEVPSLPDLDYQSRPLNIERKPQGLTIVYDRLASATARQSIHIRLSLPIREPAGDQRGAALLTARVIADAPRPRDGKPSLQQSITELGGELRVECDGVLTTFAIAVLASNWERALDELITSIRHIPDSARQIETVQAALVHSLSDQLRTAALDAAVRRLTSTIGRTRPTIEAIQDLTQLEVALAHGRTYRPDGAVLAISAPGDRPNYDAKVESILQPWLESFETSDSDSLAPLDRSPGVVWSSGAPYTKIAFVFDYPAPSSPAAAAELVALECVTAPYRGRFAQLLQHAAGRSIDFNTRRIGNGPREFLVLSATPGEGEIGLFLQAMSTAIASMQSRTPTAIQISAATARVKLRLISEHCRPASAANMTVRCARAWDGTTPTFDPLTATLAALDPATIDLTAAITMLATDGLPTAVIISDRPDKEAPAGTTIADLLRPATAITIFELDPDQQRREAQSYLDKAFAAVGGETRLREIVYCTAESRTATGRGPDVLSRTMIDRSTGQLRRFQRVLATEIDTLASNGKVTARVEDKTMQLSDEEATQLRARIDRFPVFLLIDALLGKTRYRLLSVRRVDDRNIAVIERADDSKPRLRVHIDVDSGLVRVIEHLEHLESIGLVHIVERYYDYRNVNGVRLPHFRTTTLDGSALGSTTWWSHYSLSPLPAEVFDPRLRPSDGFSHSVWSTPR